MHLNRFSDLGLRTLMVLASRREGDIRLTAGALAERLNVPSNHLVKVILKLSHLGWVITIRGRGGGLGLTPGSEKLRVGDIIRTLEGNQPLVSCGDPPCPLIKGCQLTRALFEAQGAFYASLNRLSLEDIIKAPAEKTLRALFEPAEAQKKAPLM